MTAFEQLNALLGDIEPPRGKTPIRLDLGEARLCNPMAVPGAEAALKANWDRYPPLGGCAQTRAAYRGWLKRRFRLKPEQLDKLAVEPTPGTKHGIASLVALALRAHGSGSSVVVPDPHYPTYIAATHLHDGKPAYYTCNSHPLRNIRTAIDSTVPTAAVVLCNPASPSGRPYSAGELVAIAEFTKQTGAWLLVDECYIDLWVDEEPVGALSALAEYSKVVVLHTLSKRSSAPGLRSGFVAGDPNIVGQYAALNRSCGVCTAEPIQQMSAILWSDDAHVHTSREQLARNWREVDKYFGDLPGYGPAPTGLFAWVPVTDDLGVACAAWRRAAVRIMPGRFLTADEEAGHGRVRISIGEAGSLIAGLHTLRTVLSGFPAKLREASRTTGRDS
ncbi:pyridoxal phosphate-dependent aminotransferase [Mycobacterium gordonae]|uniref:pyridoxal phosphate-dependent aminotransferase n=1 Tax=Mycobacterium gordonae TaxID=1778 RepID=UPI000AA77CB7|nr:pyridoxal phosphate-dependent aminotransferase [Mycobacterium gordonae]